MTKEKVVAKSVGSPKHDVAISFLAKDELVAKELNDLLCEAFNVFFFPAKQEDLAGTNGLETMREPFLTARVVVVLYREPWGETNWTRIEQAAITERLLEQGWDWLLFVQLDGKSKLPTWLPKTHVRFALEEYGVVQLAGAVKRRVQEQGGEITPPTALSHARRVNRDAELLADQKALFRDQRWINDTLHLQIAAIMERVSELTAEITQELGMKLTVIPAGQRCILRDDRICMNIGWRQPYINTIDEQTEIIAAEFNGPLFAPKERMMTAFPPDELGRHSFAPVLALSRDVCWIEKGKKSQPLSAEELAQRIVTLFLDLHDRANKGQIDFMRI